MRKTLEECIFPPLSCSLAAAYLLASCELIDNLDAFTDSLYFVPLAPIFDPNLVPPTIAQTLGLKEAGNQPVSDLLKEYLRNRHQFWISHAHLHEGRTFLERAVAVSMGAAPALQAKALIAVTDLALVQGNDRRGEALAEESLLFCRKVEDRAGALFKPGRR